MSKPLKLYTKNLKVLKRILFPLTDLADIDTFQTELDIEHEAEAIRQLVRLGLLVHNMKHKINDESFLAEIKQATNANTMFNYLESLDDMKLSALLEAVQLTRDNKFKQRKLV
jgi:hypothetical protein